MGVNYQRALEKMISSFLFTFLLAGLAQGSNSGYGYRSYGYPFYNYYAVGRNPYSYLPAVVTHGYGNVHHATPTPYVYSREQADPHYGEQAASAARYPYSCVPAVVTHGYGNVNHATPTPYVYSRQQADPHYGEQAARYPYSYVPAVVTHGYGNVNHA